LPVSDASHLDPERDGLPVAAAGANRRRQKPHGRRRALVAGALVAAGVVAMLAVHMVGRDSETRDTASTVLQERGNAVVTAGAKRPDLRTEDHSISVGFGLASSTGNEGQYSLAGEGNDALGSFRVRHQQMLRWTHQGGRLRIDAQVNSGSRVVSVDTQEREGSVALPPDHYRRMRLDAVGNWTVSISDQ
jgi:hypothetical protein